jgi:hypothetical protein
MAIPARDDFLDRCVKVHINMCPSVHRFRVTTAWNIEQRVRNTENIWNKMIIPDKLKEQI